MPKGVTLYSTLGGISLNAMDVISIVKYQKGSFTGHLLQRVSLCGHVHKTYDQLAKMKATKRIQKRIVLFLMGIML